METDQVRLISSSHNRISYSAQDRTSNRQYKSISIYILIYILLLHESVRPRSTAYPSHGCGFREGWMDTMKSLLGIILRSKCKCRKSVKALRKLLPTWLALMNSSQRLRQIPKWRIASMWLRWLITLLNVFLFFFLHLLQPQAITGGVCRTRGAYLFESVLWIQVWRLAQARGAHM